MALGYEPEAKVLSVPVTYASLKNKDIDIFLGNWMPTMEGDIAAYRDDGSVEILPTANLEGAKYTLATNAKGAEAGHQGFRRYREAFKDLLDGKIYGIEPGNDGNRLIQVMIDSDAFGLKGFEVVESSEQGMLAQVACAKRKDEAVVFLGLGTTSDERQFRHGLSDRRRRRFWSRTMAVRPSSPTSAKGYVAECPNVGALLGNLEVHAGDGKRNHGRDPRRRRRPEQGGEGLAFQAWQTWL